MRSFTDLTTYFGKLSQNTSTTNLDLGKGMINDSQRYLIEKYFNNEATYTLTTVAPQNLTLTGVPAQGAIVATLTAPWAFWTTQVLVQFTDGEFRLVNVVNGSTALSWDAPLFSPNPSPALTADIVVTIQFYPLPPMYSKMKDVTITIGQLKWTITEVLTRQQWDLLNVFPYYADIPSNYFIWNNQQVGIWPIPSTTGNPIIMNYKIRVPDLSITDYVAGTVSVTHGSPTVTGAGTTWITNAGFIPSAGMVSQIGLWIRIPYGKGDNNWYQVANINSDTSLTLMQPYQGQSITTATYTIGQMPVLTEDFHDLLTYRPLEIYFATIQPDPTKHTQFKTLLNEGIEMLNEYSGSKSVNVNLSQRINRSNPNLFLYK